MEDTVTTAGTLYLVALPIGNLRDITYRAVDVLRQVDLIAAEDTREFRAIQRAYDISPRVISYHDFNEQARVPQLLEHLGTGKSIALVSDAGTPLVSDPGFRIVTAAVAAGFAVTSVPGPNAAITALSASGMLVAPFVFLGFPPRVGGKRRAFYARWAGIPATLVFYESPHRLLASMTDAQAVLGERAACLARNLTKPHERYQRGTLSQIIAALQGEETVRGEATVLISGAEGDDQHDDTSAATEMIEVMLREGRDSRSILEQLIQEHHLKRREAYDLILRTRETLTDL